MGGRWRLGFYGEVVGIVHGGINNSSDNLFVKPRPLQHPPLKYRTLVLKAELDSSRKSRKKTAIQQHSKETHHSRLQHDHAADDEQLGFLTCQVTIGWRRGGIADKELSLNCVTYSEEFSNF